MQRKNIRPLSPNPIAIGAPEQMCNKKTNLSYLALGKCFKTPSLPCMTVRSLPVGCSGQKGDGSKCHRLNRVCNPSNLAFGAEPEVS